jgi:GDP-4-dehydro-6-deoxy-D-mannose reductase
MVRPRMSARTVLVTGVSGFVGRHLASALVAGGARVVGLGIESVAPADVPLEGWHTADLRDAEAMRDAVARARPEAVIHLAGQSSAARSFEDPEGTFAANVGGTRHLLEAVRAVAPRARVLVVGSSEVYGPQAEGTRTGEDAPFAPVSPYAESKAEADRLAEAYASGPEGLDIIRVRAFSHIGPGQGPAFVVPTLARQIAGIEAGRSAPVLRVGNLEVVRDLSDVRDVARAYLALLERGARRAYNVCRGEGVRLSDVAARLAGMARVTPRIEVDPARLRPADLPWLVGDPSRIARDTGWRATTPLERTLADVLAEWRGRGGSDTARVP